MERQTVEGKNEKLKEKKIRMNRILLYVHGMTKTP